MMSLIGLTTTTPSGGPTSGQLVGSVLMTLWLPESLRWMLYKVLISIALILTIRNEIPVHGTNIRLTQRNNHANISELLDNLLRGYDNSVRPDFGGPPATIEVDIMVRSMGPISEVDMTYSMDCYFRQSWVDKRLAFQGAQDTLALSVSMLARIWKPDTYFYNGKQSYLHTITTPNKFVRIYQDGRVLYSSRLTIKAGCPMNLEDFPMDIQRCPLKFGSFGYTTNDVLYRWNRARQPVAIAEDMKLSQFDLVDCPAGNTTDTVQKIHTKSTKSRTHNQHLQHKEQVRTIKAEYSMLMVNFHLQRHMGNFLIQVYGPCCLLVVLSWVSFWLNREATADRVSLGITTVLTMTFLGLEARTDLPKVPYPTALDFFVFLSFAFIFATILQFAVVHYFTKYGSGECYFIIDDEDSASDTDHEDEATLRNISGMPSEFNTSTESKIYEVIPLSMCSFPIAPSNRRPYRYSCFGFRCFRKDEKHKTAKEHTVAEEVVQLRAEETTAPSRRASSFRPEEAQFKTKSKRKPRQPQFNSVSKIDRASRVVFPLLFLIINLFYWTAYLSRSSRILTGIDSGS
ncbi:gamma-aminobutyric acid receptor alpha-like [Eupeodes corollae]|uniref:gamma-aminobutyric acid receptor alpha-like n=1 Tax=Eupeodes corollae TaxID=290404 RepID=UPI0024927A20|nr:gamma-aminobutyric acid receptor alpha-like [Eupeodes corollae]